MEAELKTVQAELRGVHQAQQMLIETNHAHHMELTDHRTELAEFKELFKGKLPLVAAVTGARQKLLDILNFLQEYDTQQEYQIELCYRYTRNRDMVAEYRISFVEDEVCILGTWEHYVRVLPFTVPGQPSYLDDDRWPSIVLWRNMQDLETLALDQLVNGKYGWELVLINVIPSDSNPTQSDGEPIWDIQEGTPYPETTMAN